MSFNSKQRNSTYLPTIAAIDLGSHSFRLAIAHCLGNGYEIIEQQAQPVQLATHLILKQQLSSLALKQALNCIDRFRQCLDRHQVSHVLAVGTHALRQLVNRSDFLIQAQQALGYPIKVISGEQEACFIYQGLLDQLACPEQTTLVIDIGGGSTEFIIGQGKQTQLLHSLDVGCLGYSQRYFSQGQISKQRLEQASLAACQAVATIAPHITSHNWQLAVGTSGAIQLLQQVVNACGWDQPCQLSAASLAKLSELTAGFSHTRQLALAGLNLQRREIFPASLAILRGIFTALNLTTLGYIEGGLIRGLLEQLLVRQRSAVAAN